MNAHCQVLLCLCPVPSKQGQVDAGAGDEHLQAALLQVPGRAVQCGGGHHTPDALPAAHYDKPY